MTSDRLNTLTIRAMSAPWHAGVDFRVENEDGHILSDEGFKELPRYIRADPSFSISIQEAQTLMDDLWNAGLRPTEGAGSAGSLRATESHLKDMRLIAFKKLGIDK